TENSERAAERVLNGRYGRMSLSILAQTPAKYRIEAQASTKNATAGRYEIRMTERRPGAERDGDSVAAEQAATEGWLLGSKRNAESYRQAREKFETAWALWRKLGDRYGQGVALYGLGQARQAQYQFQEAFECYDQAISHFRAAAAGREATMMRNL